MTSNAVQRLQTSGALRVAAAWIRLRCSASSTMTRHRLDRRAWHPGSRRSQRDPRDFYHGLLGVAERHPEVLDDPASRALLMEFGDDALKFELWVFVDFGKGLTTKDELLVAIDQAFEDEGIQFALPRLSIQVPAEGTE